MIPGTTREGEGKELSGEKGETERDGEKDRETHRQRDRLTERQRERTN